MHRRLNLGEGVRLLLLALLPCARSQVCLAQASATAASPDLPQVLILGDLERGAVLGDTAPLIELSAPQIESFGVSSVSELLTELAPETASSRGRTDAPPVPLLNGRRISSWAEIGDIPTEAIERVEVFPEDLALKYGYAADQKVVNFIVREHYRALSADGEGEVASEGGAVVARGHLDYIRLTEGGRLNLDLSFEQDNRLLERQRGLHTITAGSAFDQIGNLTAAGSAAGGEIDPALSALAGETVTVAGVPVLPAGVTPSLGDFLALANTPRETDLSPDRTLRPATQKFHLNAVSSWTTSAGVYTAVNAGVDATDTGSLQGLASASLLVPSGNPFSPFSSAVQINRLLPELGPLRQQTDGVTYHVGFSLDGNLHHWTWSVTGSEQHVATRTRTQTGVDLTAAQALLDADDPTLDPFMPLPGSLLTGRSDDHATLSSDSANLQLLAQGTVRELPAGSLAGTVKLGEEASRIESDSTLAGSAQSSSLFRHVSSAQLNLDVPLSSRKHGVLRPVGDLETEANLTVQQVSDFGTLYGMNAGLHWSPSDRLNLAVSGTDDEAAPSLPMLSSPTILTPNVPTFDYVTGQTVSVTQLSGGNPQLAADHRELLSLTLSYRPLLKRNFTLNANYITSDTHELTGPLPAATAAAEAAFPDRYLRDADGDLVEVDGRAVNFSREQRTQLRWGLNSYWPLGSETQGPTNLLFAIHDTWFCRDAILIRSGLPELDLLDGGTVGASGGQPRQQIDLQAGFTHRWFGARISDRWHEASTVEGGSPGADLSFSGLMTANLRLFADLGDASAMQGSGWAHGLRVVLAADNVFNEHQRVRDATGAVPSAYQSAYLDPLGRVIRLDLRKVF
jgi:hypothetical protein